MINIFGILAHKNPIQLSALVRYLNIENQIIIIHLDKKADLLNFKNKIPTHKNIIWVTNRIKVFHGHISIVEATLEIMKLASKFSNYYFHLISGEDFPSKPISVFNQFFENNKGKNFINFNIQPIEKNNIHYPPNNKFNFDVSSLKNYNITNRRDQILSENYLTYTKNKPMNLLFKKYFKKQDFMQSIDTLCRQYPNKLYLLHKLLTYKFNKNMGFENYYCGSAWFSISEAAMNYILNFLKINSKILKKWQYVAFPDEQLFQTILLNSNLASTCVNSDLRYIDWLKTDIKRVPVVIKKEEIEFIFNSFGFFTRKLDFDPYEK